MHAVLDAVNRLVTLLNTVSPGWYIVAVGPLANVAQHFIKLERDADHKLTRGQNQLLAVLFAAVAGAFYGVLHTPQGIHLHAAADLWLRDTALVGTPIWVIATALFFGVSNKLEERHVLLSQLNPATVVAEANAAPADVPAEPAAPATPATESGVDASGNVTV